MTFDDVVDFYIVLLQLAAVGRAHWLVCAGPTSRCLAVHEDQAAAIAHARAMAEYRVSAGKTVQIHVRQESGQPWKTVWCSEGTLPKHP